MARRPRVVVEGGLYHVYNRVASGERIFADPNKAIEFIEIAKLPFIAGWWSPWESSGGARKERSWQRF